MKGEKFTLMQYALVTNAQKQRIEFDIYAEKLKKA